MRNLPEGVGRADQLCAMVCAITQVLFVCTGNVCRSPTAEWFLNQRLSQVGPDDVSVESVGTMGSSMPVPQSLLDAGADFGLDLSDHVSHRMEVDTIRRADLVVGMAREHVREVVLADPPSLAKSFTLRELMRLGQQAGPREGGHSLAEWLGKVGAGRRHVELIGESPRDDIPDPMGGAPEDFRQLVAELAVLTRALHALVWP
jgi:protein-tyrosine phosphatase